MNHDEFSFFNQQLAAMLRDGIPLEGAVQQLCSGMRTGPLRRELETLEADLRSGTPLPAALARRELPEFYTRMVTLGARTNDLPGVLILLADHYSRVNALWTRLKGLLVYPLIVIVVSLGLTCLLSLTFERFLNEFQITGLFSSRTPPSVLITGIWVPPVALALLAVMFVTGIAIPAWRNKLR